MRLPNPARRAYRKVLAARRDLIDLPNTRRVVLEHVGATPIVVIPGVLNPKRTRTGALLAEWLDETLVPRGSQVLDLGTGSGIGAVFAARFASHVVASDINPTAVRNTRVNVLLHSLEAKVEVRLGDLFEPVPNLKFDVVLFNPPYLVGTPKDLTDLAWRSTDVLARFASGLPNHLRDGGHALVVWSSDADEDALLGPLSKSDLTFEVVRERDLINEVVKVWRIRRA
ncbi:MAG: methyltransferase [Deltaproteobacteria bacterium]|nr:methyltransferase [Deltaproteobacteria bacterium]